MTSVSDLQHAMLKYAKTYEQYKNTHLNLSDFTDGSIFVTILRSATSLSIKYEELIEKCQKWTFKLSNLKKIVSAIEDYFEETIKKGVRTKDIDLLQIAKNNNTDEILKFFELVVATITEAPNKEDHINVIMSLDERSQSSFVSIIQNLLENRILDKNESKSDKNIETLNHLQMENTLLRSQVQSLLNENWQLNKHIEELKSKQEDYEEELSKFRDQEIDKISIIHESPKEKEHMKNMIDNLKQKLINTVRENEVKVFELKEEISILESKSVHFEEVEEQLENYKRKYAETIESNGKVKLWEKQRNKLIRTIEEKQELLKKLNLKLDESNELNYAMQEREVYSKMELQKRDVRFKQLEKEIKRKSTSAGLIDLNPGSSKGIQPASSSGILGKQIDDLEQEEIEELKSQLEQAKKKLRESQRENNKLKRNAQKNSNMEMEKKKLQRLIMSVNNEKREQIEVLLSTTYDFYAQNERLRRIMDDNKIGY